MLKAGYPLPDLLIQIGICMWAKLKLRAEIHRQQCVEMERCLPQALVVLTTQFLHLGFYNLVAGKLIERGPPVRLPRSCCMTVSLMRLRSPSLRAMSLISGK